MAVELMEKPKKKTGAKRNATIDMKTVATEKMAHWVESARDPDDLHRRALNQMARETLLAQASDWAFLMTAGTAIQYSQKRTRDHVHRFLILEREFSANQINEAFLKECEWKDNIFPNINYRIFTHEGVKP